MSLCCSGTADVTSLTILLANCQPLYSSCHHVGGNCSYTGRITVFTHSSLYLFCTVIPCSILGIVGFLYGSLIQQEISRQNNDYVWFVVSSGFSWLDVILGSTLAAAH